VTVVSHPDSFSARHTVDLAGQSLEIFRLDALQPRFDVARLPYSLKVLLENLLRNEDGKAVTREDIEALAGWDPHRQPSEEIAYTPSGGQDAWIYLIHLTGLSSLLGAINFYATIANMRAPGMSWGRLPLFIWGVLVY